MSSYISADPQNNGYDWWGDLIDRLLWLEMEDEDRVFARLRAIEADVALYNARFKAMA